MRALLLQALYGKRSERLLMEELDYSLLFRWFVGLAMDDAVWDTTVFSKNRDRLIEGEIASGFFLAVRGQLQRSGMLSDEHFTVDGTMLEAWANRRSFQPKAEPPQRGSGRGGKRLLRDTHESRTDPEARLYRKCNAGAAQPSYLGHVLRKRSWSDRGRLCDRSGDTRRAGSSLALVGRNPRPAAADAGADKQYQEREFVTALRQRGIVPHIAEYEHGNLQQRNSLRVEERNSLGFVQSQKKRKLVEQSFAWIKHWAGFRQVKLRSRRRVEWLFQIAAAAYNLVRMNVYEQRWWEPRRRQLTGVRCRSVPTARMAADKRLWAGIWSRITEFFSTL